MESTLKIDYQGRGTHFVPVIKIVQPIVTAGTSSDDEFDDPKDKLIYDFLNTPLMNRKNSLFEVHSNFSHPSENPKVYITTISAIEEDNLFSRIKRIIQERLISDYDFYECHNKDKSNNVDNEVPMPIGFDKYQKIETFFDWLSKEDYWNNTSPEITSREGDEVQTPGGFEKPIKDIRYRLEMLPEEARTKAFDMVNPNNYKLLNESSYNTDYAIMALFGGANLKKETQEYWSPIIQEADKEYHLLMKIDNMCTESLDSDTHNKWEDVKEMLVRNRQNL